MGKHLWRDHASRKRVPGIPHARSREVERFIGGIFGSTIPSRTNSGTVHAQGLRELDAIYRFETSPLIAAYRDQPKDFSYSNDDERRRDTRQLDLTLVNTIRRSPSVPQ
jgi:hypothetical protein